MSVDQRLREAFRAEDDWVPDVSLHDVRTEARRGTTRRRTASAAAAAVVLVGGLAVAVSVDGRSDRADPALPAPTASPSAEAPAEASAVEGTWLTPPFSASRVRRTLDRAGWGEARRGEARRATLSSPT